MQRDVPVREVIEDGYVGVSPGDDLGDAADLLLAEGAAVALVLEGSDVVGALTPRAVVEHVVGGGTVDGATVAEAMQERVPTIRPDRSLAETRDRMAARSSGWLLVTDGTDPRGVVTERDLLAGSALGSETTTEAGEQAALAGPGGASTESETAVEDAYDEQGICEVCGSLTADLAAFNGQLRCPDCRTV